MTKKRELLVFLIACCLVTPVFSSESWPALAPLEVVVDGFLVTGYVNRQGEMIIPPRYYNGGEFRQGAAVVSLSPQGIRPVREELIDAEGRLLLQPLPLGRSRAVTGYIDGVFRISDEDAEYFVDVNGKTIMRSEGVAFFGKSLIAAFESDGKWGVLDIRKKIVLTPPTFTRRPNIYDDAMVVNETDSNRAFLLNMHGEVIPANDYFLIGGVKEGLLYAVDKRAAYGYIDTSGREVIKPQYYGSFGFSEGLARTAVKTEDNGSATVKWGYINPAGHFIIDPKFDDAGDFTEGLAAVAICDPDGGPKRWGYIDTGGEFVIKPQYEEVRTFQNGYAVVKLNGKDGVIDSSGKVFLPCEYYGIENKGSYFYVSTSQDMWQFDSALYYLYSGEALEYYEEFNNGLIMKIKGGKGGYYDKAGNAIVRIEFLRGRYAKYGARNVYTPHGNYCVPGSDNTP